MALAHFAKRWNAKPPLGAQIDPTHPLAQGLVRAYILNEGGGRPVDLVRNRLAADVGPGNTWTMGPTGPTLAFNPSASNWVWDADATTSGPFTLVIKCLWDGSSHSSQYVWLFNHYWNNYVNSSANDTYLRFVRNWSTGWEARLYPLFSSASNANKWWHFAWVCPAVARTSLLYVNGNEDAGVLKDESSAGTPVDFTEFTFGAYDGIGSVAGPWTGEIDHVLLYNRALPKAEVRQLCVDPYCFMQPQSPK